MRARASAATAPPASACTTVRTSSTTNHPRRMLPTRSAREGVAPTEVDGRTELHTASGPDLRPRAGREPQRSSIGRRESHGAVTHRLAFQTRVLPEVDDAHRNDRADLVPGLGDGAGAGLVVLVLRRGRVISGAAAGGTPELGLQDLPHRPAGGGTHIRTGGADRQHDRGHDDRGHDDHADVLDAGCPSLGAVGVPPHVDPLVDGAGPTGSLLAEETMQWRRATTGTRAPRSRSSGGSADPPDERVPAVVATAGEGGRHPVQRPAPARPAAGAMATVTT